MKKKLFRYFLIVFISSCYPQISSVEANNNISWFKETYSIPDSLINNISDYYITQKSKDHSSFVLLIAYNSGKVIAFDPKTNQIRLNIVDTLKGETRIVANDLENFVIQGEYGFNIYSIDSITRYIPKSVLPEDVYIQIIRPFEYDFKSKSLLTQLLDFRDKEKRRFTLDHNVLGILDSTNSLRSIDYRVSNAFGNGKLVDPYLLSSIHSDNGFTSSLSHSDSTVLVSLNSKKEPVYTYWGKHFNPENFIKSTDTTAMGYFKNRQKNIESYSYGKSMVLKPKNGIALQIRFLFLPKMLAPESNTKYTTHPVRVLVQDSLGNPLPHFDLPGNTHFNFEKWFTNGQSIGHLNFLSPMNSETRMVYLEVFTPVVY